MSESWEFGSVDDPVGVSSPRTHPFPWPPVEGAPVLAAFGATWKGATFDPGRFFRRTPRERGTGAALLYYLSIGLLVAGVTLFWDSFALLSNPMTDSPFASDLGIEPIDPLVAFLLSPAFLLLGLAVATGVVHVLLLLFGGARHGFGTTVRVYCYASSPTLFGVVPFLGTVVGGIWSLVLLIIGLREAHEADGWKAAVAVLLPFVLMVGFMFLLVVAMMVALGTALPTSG